MLMDDKEGMYQISGSQGLADMDYDYVMEDGVARIAEMTYFSVSEEFGNGGNYIPLLKAGESIQVNMAWIVNADVLDNCIISGPKQNSRMDMYRRLKSMDALIAAAVNIKQNVCISIMLKKIRIKIRS